MGAGASGAGAVPAGDLEQWQHAVTQAPTRLVYAETLSNPQLRLLDIPAVARIAHRPARSSSSTTPSRRPGWCGRSSSAPMSCCTRRRNPNGHSDVIAGAILTDAARARACRQRVVTFGATLDPHSAYLLSRGMKTLGLRMQRASATAAQLAATLENLDESSACSTPACPRSPTGLPPIACSTPLDPERCAAS